MTNQLRILNLYPAAICNLNCVYCYIDKSPALQKIDNILTESFNSDYYLDFSKELFDKEVLQGIHFWGGEPSMGLHKVYKLIPKFIDYYPNLKGFSMSTNFTIPNWFDEFYGFLNILKSYPQRQFEFNLQLSIDGPEYINDANRGKGVTKIFLEHYKDFINTININLPANVIIKAHFKPTYSNKTIALLQNKNDIIEYFTFFDNLITDFKAINNPRVSMTPTIPNCASPGAYTVKDGENFANYCKLTREIEKDNLFKNYKNITSYPPRNFKNYCKNNTCFNLGCYNCGAGLRTIGLLPEKQLSLCHSGFANLLEEYKINSKNNHCNDEDNSSILKELYTHNQEAFSTCISFDDYPKIKEIFLHFEDRNQTFQMVNAMALIQSLAAAGQVEKRFLNKQDAYLAAQYLLNSTPWCMRDSANVTGSITLPTIGYCKLLLNGAYEYIIGEKE